MLFSPVDQLKLNKNYSIFIIYLIVLNIFFVNLKLEIKLTSHLKEKSVENSSPSVNQ